MSDFERIGPNAWRSHLRSDPWTELLRDAAIHDQTVTHGSESFRIVKIGDKAAEPAGKLLAKGGPLED